MAGVGEREGEVEEEPVRYITGTRPTLTGEALKSHHRLHSAEESKHRVAENLPRFRLSSISNSQLSTLPLLVHARPNDKMSPIRFIHAARRFAHTAVARDASASQLPYLVHRNSRGSIPVYTDVRNAGTRYLVLIRNVEGNVNVRPCALPPFGSRVFSIETLENHLTFAFACFV